MPRACGPFISNCVLVFDDSILQLLDISTKERQTSYDKVKEDSVLLLHKINKRVQQQVADVAS